jgi:hypothetical protein
MGVPAFVLTILWQLYADCDAGCTLAAARLSSSLCSRRQLPHLQCNSEQQCAMLEALHVLYLAPAWYASAALTVLQPLLLLLLLLLLLQMLLMVTRCRLSCRPAAPSPTRLGCGCSMPTSRRAARAGRWRWWEACTTYAA